MKLLGIARVSTEEQAGDNGAGLNRQHDAIQRVVEANSSKLIGIVNIVDVSRSAGHGRQPTLRIAPPLAGHPWRTSGSRQLGHLLPLSCRALTEGLR